MFQLKFYNTHTNTEHTHEYTKYSCFQKYFKISKDKVTYKIINVKPNNNFLKKPHVITHFKSSRVAHLRH